MNPSNTSSKKYINKILSASFFFILLILTIYYMFRDIVLKKGHHGIIEILEKADYRLLALGMFLVLLYVFMQGVIYRCVLNSLGVRKSILSSFFYSCADFYGSSITPCASGGEPLVIFYMAKDGIPIHKSSITLLLHAVAYKAVLIILCIAALIYNPAFILESGPWGRWLFTLGIAINIIVIAVCLFMMFSGKTINLWGRGVINFLTKIKIVKNKENVLEKFDNAHMEYKASAEHLRKNPIVTIKVFTYTIIQRIAAFSVAYLVFVSLQYTSSNFFDLFFIQIILAVSVDSLPFPGAMGAAEIMFGKFFRMVYLTRSAMNSARLLTRGITYYFCLIITALITLANHIRILKRDKKN